MRDLWLWTAYVVGSGAVGGTISFVVRRLFDRQRERRYVPPSVLYTEVRPRFYLPPAVAFPAPAARPQPSLPAWGLALLVNFLAHEAKVQRAIAGEVTSAPIWAEIHGRRHVQGLAVA